MIHTPICDMLGIEYPIFQGGMAWIADGKLAAAVSNGGGLGIISAMNAGGDYLREQIRICRELTDKPFGVNVMLMSPHVEEVAALLAEEKVPVITTGAGNPSKYMKSWLAAGIRVIPVVASVAMARLVARAGAAAVIAEGGESGGHVGELTTIVLTPQIVDAVDIPVIAAGGIGDGRGVAGAFAMGAEGVQCGTAFIVADECNASDGYKDAIVNALESDTRVYRNPGTGRNVRTVTSPLVEKYFEVLKEEGYDKAKLLMGGGIAHAMKDGDPEQSTFMAGQSAGSVVRRGTCREIIERMMQEAREAALEQVEKWR